MSERQARQVLADLRSATRQVTLYPVGHPATDEVLAATAASANQLAGIAGGEAILNLITDSFYLGREILPHASLEFNGLLREMQVRGIESFTLVQPVSKGDIGDLASFIAGLSGDIPAEGTVRLNESAFAISELESEAAFGGLRRSYARSLDVLRGVSMAVSAEQDFDLSGAIWAVEQLVERAVAQPAASVLLATMKSHDEYTFYHSVNVCILGITLGRLIGIEEEQLKLLSLGALLHDIGKVKVSAATLQYPGRLDSDQWAEIKLHPQEGAAAILAAAEPAQEVAAIVAFEHHARFDGLGYPSQHQRGQQHFFSRLVATADTYDALTTRRSYRRAETPNRALHILLKGAGTMYDPDFVRAFIKMVGVYPPGSLLELDGGEIVMVTLSVEGAEAPNAVMVRTGAGVLLETPEPIQLGGRQIIGQVTPERAGVDPASLLEQAGIPDPE